MTVINLAQRREIDLLTDKVRLLEHKNRLQEITITMLRDEVQLLQVVSGRG